jgi:hypothetical protein
MSVLQKGDVTAEIAENADINNEELCALGVLYG